jgi:hypothetical protein
MKRHFLGFVVFAGVIAAANMARADGTVVNGWWEHGTETCDTWTGAREAQGADELIYRAWVDGYLAGVRGGVGEIPSGPRIAASMDSYCRAHPGTTLIEAVKKLKL